MSSYESDIWLASANPDKTETCCLIISKIILHHLEEISKLNTQLFLLMSCPPETRTRTHTNPCPCAHTRTYTQESTCKRQHRLTQTHIRSPQMDRCCTSRGTGTQQLFPSQSDGRPLIVHEYFTLSQNGCFPGRLREQPHRTRWSSLKLWTLFHSLSIRAALIFLGSSDTDRKFRLDLWSECELNVKWVCIFHVSTYRGA